MIYRCSQTSKSNNIFQLTLLAVSLAVLSFFSLNILQNFPNSADEYAYVFQAKNLARLQTYHHVHPKNAVDEHIQPYFYFVHIGETDGKYYGRFPFGYSLLMVPAAWLELLLGVDGYWLINVLFGSLTLLLLYQFGHIFFNVRVARLAAGMGLLSAWFIFNSGSYFSHATNAFFIGGFLFSFCFALAQEKIERMRKYFALAGFLFGFAVIIRFLDPLPFLFVVSGLYIAWGNSNKNFLNDAAFFVCGGLFWLVALLLYNYSLTGDALQTAYQYYNPHDQSTRFVFLVPENGENRIEWHRIYDIGFLKNTYPNIKLLFEWHIWTWLLVLVPIALWKKRLSSAGKKILLLFTLAPILVIAIYMLYGGPPMNQYGPRYFYSFLVPLTLAAAICLDALFSNRWLLMVVFVLLAIPATKQIYKHSQHFYEAVYDRTNLFRTIKSAQLNNAVVFLKSGSGTMHQVDLPRNSLDFDNDVLIAQDLEGNYGPLIRAYPERSFYEYRYVGRDKLGKLTRLVVKSNGNYAYQGTNIDSKHVLINSNGLIGEYYAGKNFDNLMAQRLDHRIDFDWRDAAPAEGISVDGFSVRWQGLLNLPKSGEYKFYATSDDGIRIFVDNKPLVNSWYSHGSLTETVTQYLDAGEHHILIEYFDDIYHAHLDVKIEGPGLPLQVLSGELLTAVVDSRMSSQE